MRASWGILLLLALLISGCVGKETQLPATTKLLDDLPRVANSTKAPCRMQREVAAQNSYVATIKAKKPVVFKAPCDVDEPKPTS